MSLQSIQRKYHVGYRVALVIQERDQRIAELEAQLAHERKKCEVLAELVDDIRYSPYGTPTFTSAEDALDYADEKAREEGNASRTTS